MSGSEEFRERQAKRASIENLVETWERARRKVTDGRIAEALAIAEDGLKASDALGADFTVNLYPICIACAGYGEMQSPSETDRKVRCQDVPSVCKGNQYGRMHPVQLVDYLSALCPVAPIGSEDCSGGEASGGESGEPSKTEDDPGEMRPTPPPPYVYSRSAVIAFNANRVGAGEPGLIPVPEEDEEVLAHADGTFTVRKIGG